MKSLGHYVFVRHRQNWNLLFRFGLVGGSGVLVNLLVADPAQADRPALRGRRSSTCRDRVQHPLVPPVLDGRVPRRQPLELPAQPALHVPQREALGLVARVRAVPGRRAGRPSWSGSASLTLLMHPGSFLSLPSDVLRQLHRPADEALLGAADRHRRHGPAVVRAEQALDLLRRSAAACTPASRRKRSPRSGTAPHPPDPGPGLRARPRRLTPAATGSPSNAVRRAAPADHDPLRG